MTTISDRLATALRNNLPTSDRQKIADIYGVHFNTVSNLIRRKNRTQKTDGLHVKILNEVKHYASINVRNQIDELKGESDIINNSKIN